MIAELRAAKLFEGYRGKPAADKEALAAGAGCRVRDGHGAGAALKELDITPFSCAPPARAWSPPTRSWS
jgi:hypothetical protein